MTKIISDVEDLRPAAENAHVEKALEAVPGVQSVAMEAGEKRMVVEHDAAKPEEILSALRSAGYSRAKVVG